MAPATNAVFATLLMNDAYLPGAMVLGHSLKDRGAKAKLVALVVIEKLAPTTVTELQTVWDEVVPVQQIMNSAPANLYLMGRPDLISAFTKIQLWKQTQYQRIVYIDADVVALRAPTELLTIDTQFAAVPDIGWPDCFNSGVMVLNPNMADYYALLALAERGISFDGADQGLLNMHFSEWERLSFKYNCTPSGNYQYVPAYRHFQSGISLVHFIGRDKPWNLGRGGNIYNTGVYGELLGRWWTVYDKHYRGREIVYYDGQWQQAPKRLQDYVAGEETIYLPANQAPPPVAHSSSPGQNVYTPSGDAPSGAAEQPMGDHPTIEEQITSNEFEPTPTVQQRRWSAPHAEWQPDRAPPPVNSKPEASNFPSQIYDFSQDVKLFRPPASYPEAPKDMWYEVPAKPAPQPAPKPIFPWESRAPKATRVFPETQYTSSSPTQLGLPNARRSSLGSGAQSSPQPQTERQIAVQQETRHEPPRPASPPKLKQIFPWESRAPKPTRVFPRSPPSEPSVPEPEVPQPQQSPAQHIPEQPQQDQDSQGQQQARTQLSFQPSQQQQEEWKEHVQSHLQPTVQNEDTATANAVPPVDTNRETVTTGTGILIPKEPWVNPWEAFKDRSNAWDDMPEITAYVQALQPPKRGKIQVLHHTPSIPQAGEIPGNEGQGERRESILITDFPTPNERPSLPVTPAPIRRPTFWGDEQDMSGELPNAEGVPDQIEWNPLAKLEELQRQQSQALLGKEDLTDVKQPPLRDLPDSASKEAVEAAVEKTSPTSIRPLKPILKEPHFELAKEPNNVHTDDSANDVHDAVEEDLPSPGDPGDRTSNSSTPTPQTVQ